LQCLEDVEISEAYVAASMHHVSDKLSHIPDGIPAVFWKRVSAPFYHNPFFLP